MATKTTKPKTTKAPKTTKPKTPKKTKIPRPKAPKKIPRPKQTKQPRPPKEPKSVDTIEKAPAARGRPAATRTKSDAAVKFGRQAGTALGDALDSAMPQILAGDYAGAYEVVLSKIKGGLLDTLNRTLGNYGLPPVDESGPDNDYWIAAVQKKCGLDIQDLSAGGIKDYGEKVVWVGIGKAVGVDMAGVTTVDDAIDRCVKSVEDGNIRISTVLSGADKAKAEVMRAVRDAGKTWDDYEKARNRRNASEAGRAK